MLLVTEQIQTGPRTVLLQILLNRLGADLKVDGLFGSKTKTAVEKFEKLKHLPPDGKAGPPVWHELLQGGLERVVDVVDVGDPTLQNREAKILREAGSPPIELGMMCNGVGQMVTDVLRRAKGGKIVLLRIIGHGNFGTWFTVSVGNVAHLPKAEKDVIRGEYYSYLSPEHLDELLPLIAPLRSQFSPFGGMEHGGCSLGSVPATRKMMQRLADTLGIPVTAAHSTQNETLFFQGRTYTAYPYGMNLDTWSKQFRDRPM